MNSPPFFSTNSENKVLLCAKNITNIVMKMIFGLIFAIIRKKFNDEKINIIAVSLANNPDGTISITLSLEASNLAQLSRLLVKIEGIRGVISATRIGERPPLAPTSQPEFVPTHTKPVPR